MAHSDASNFPR